MTFSWAVGYTCRHGSAAVQPADTVDRIIRNQRYRGWPLLLWLCVWCTFWMSSALELETWLLPTVYYGFPWHALLWVGWVVPMLASYIVLIIKIEHRPTRRLKLGADMWVVPGPRYPPKEILAFHF